MKLLLIEDDLMLANGLSKALRNEGFVVLHAKTGELGISLCDDFTPDIVVLDLGLPDIDGTEVLRQLRLSYRHLPILILTARESLTDKVNALDSGADDYLLKPFEIDELMARVRVLVRRLGTASSSEIIITSVTLDTVNHIVKVDDTVVQLTSRELMILKALMQNAGRIQTKQMIEDKLYGWGDEVSSNTIEVHISNLRKKLPENFIRTIRGVGYTINSSHNSTI